MAEESTVQLELTLTLPASLAREAEAQGLLTSTMLEALVRAEVRRRPCPSPSPCRGRESFHRPPAVTQSGDWSSSPWLSRA